MDVSAEQRRPAPPAAEKPEPAPPNVDTDTGEIHEVVDAEIVDDPTMDPSWGGDAA